MRIWVIIIVLDLLGIAWLQVLHAGRLHLHQTGRWYIALGLGCFAIAVGMAVGRGAEGGCHFVCFSICVCRWMSVERKLRQVTWLILILLLPYHHT